MAVPNTDSFTLLNIVDEVNPSTDNLYQSFEESIADNFDTSYIPSGFDPHKDDKSGYEQLYFRNYGDDQASSITAIYSYFVCMYTAGPYLVAVTDTDYIFIFKIWDTGDIALISSFNSYYNPNTSTTETYSNLRDIDLYYNSNTSSAYLFIPFIYTLDDVEGKVWWHELKIEDRDGVDANITFFDYGTGDYYYTMNSKVKSIMVSDYDSTGSPRTVVLMSDLQEGPGDDIEVWSFFYHLDGSKNDGSIKDEVQYHSEASNKDWEEIHHKLIDREGFTNTSYFAAIVLDGSGDPVKLRIRELDTTPGTNWGQEWETSNLDPGNNFREEMATPFYARPYPSWNEIFAVRNTINAYYSDGYNENQEVVGYKFDYNNPGINTFGSVRYSDEITGEKGWMGHTMCASEDNLYVIRYEDNNDLFVIHRFSYTSTSLTYKSSHTVNTKAGLNSNFIIESVTSSETDTDSSKDIIYLMAAADDTYRYGIYIIKVVWDNATPSNDSYEDISLPPIP